MSLFWHLLRKELFVARLFIVPLILLHLVRLAELLRWLGSPAPSFDGETMRVLRDDGGS